MTVISILDRIETKGSVYVTVGDELMGKNAAENFTISKNEWKKLTDSRTITVGMPLTEDLYRDISSAGERTKAVRLGASITSGSDKSASAVLRKLRDAGISKESAEHAVALLIRRGYIDEDAQCERIADTLLRYKRYGRGRIVQYLIAHGYPADVAKKAASSLEEEDVLAALSKTIEKKYPDIDTYSPADTKKAVASLMRLGFTSAEIFGEIRRITKNKN